jgi:L-asparaginase
LPEIVDFDFVPLMNKDSTNMNPGDWTRMAKAVYERRDNGYSGFVIAHGTDTMHFSASALAFALGRDLNFPVVLTGAQTIPEVRHGDARVNLLRACKVASALDLAEVVISFGEYVFRGCRAQKKDERRFDAFESPAFPPAAYITEEIVLSPWVFPRRKTPGPDIELRANFEVGVLQVSLIPGLEPDLLRPILESGECKGVTLQSFGAGNVPNEEPYSFAKIIRRAAELNKPVIITSQFPANATLHTSYEPGRAAIEAGAIPTGNMTSACATAKFRWVLAQVEEQVGKSVIRESQRVEHVSRMMQTVYVGEMDIPNGGWQAAKGLTTRQGRT